MVFKGLKEIKANLAKTGYQDYPVYLALRAREAKEVLLEPLPLPIPATISLSKVRKAPKENEAGEDDLDRPVLWVLPGNQELWERSVYQDGWYAYLNLYYLTLYYGNTNYATIITWQY